MLWRNQEVPIPPQFIDKRLPISQLLAQVVASEFADHMPFYRQESWFVRANCPISSATIMWGWENKVAFEIAPLVNYLKQDNQTEIMCLAIIRPCQLLIHGQDEQK
ncbi:MAG: IS66 family transposase [Alphaproteobacteria bacterium]|nr:IS66 family transposase [Alphaproteobacteria bacterium]